LIREAQTHGHSYGNHAGQRRARHLDAHQFAADAGGGLMRSTPRPHWVANFGDAALAAILRFWRCGVRERVGGSPPFVDLPFFHLPAKSQYVESRLVYAVKTLDGRYSVVQ
jgi:hypothetical protein